MILALQFRWRCPGCGNATTGFRDIPSDKFRGHERFCCQWCDRTIDVHWTTTIMAVRYDFNGNFDEIFASIEEIPNFEIEEADQGEKTIQ